MAPWKQLLAAAVVAAIGSVLILRPWHDPYALPAFDSAVLIDGSSGRPFSIAPADLWRLREAFDGNHRELFPKDREYLGTLRLSLGERTTEILLFQNAGGPGAFRVGKGDYLGYDSHALVDIVAARYR